MSAAEEAMEEIIARRLALIQGEGEDRGGLLTHAGLARLLVAMVLSCGGNEDCSDCLLSGTGLCVFCRADFDQPVLCASNRTGQSR